MGFDFGSFLEDAAPALLTAGGFAVGGPTGAMIGAGLGSAISGAKANRQNRELAEQQMAFQERMSNVPGVNVNPGVDRNRIFCSCCGGDLDVDEVVGEK